LYVGDDPVRAPRLVAYFKEVETGREEHCE
jgi:hypothetical protein